MHRMKKEMRRELKLLPWLAVLLLIVVALAALRGAWLVAGISATIAAIVALGYAYICWSLPQLRGTVRVSGLRDSVEIIRDSDAIPHIYAQNKLDTWFGLGYVHAQERLWQMEMQRRLSQGRMSELFGRSSVSIDRFFRTVGIARAAQCAWEALSADSRAIVEAYTAGINAAIATRRNRLALEWLLLRTRPAPWTGTDVLSCLKLVAMDLGGTYEIEQLRSDIIAVVGAERAAQLLPGYPEDGPVIVPTRSSSASQQRRGVAASLRTLTGVDRFGGGAVGSNNWVVDGAKSASGKPMLANDPHMGTSMPSLWYLAHLSGGDLDVIGATIPGLPGVVIGRNRSIAWGLTNLNPDVQDLFREHLDQSGRMVEFQGQMEPIEEITETIKVKGRPAIQHRVRITRHGPLISDALDMDTESQPTDQHSEPAEPLALRWTALDPDDSTLEAFHGINEARDWDQFRDALRRYVAPAVNFVYADVAGHIGYYAPGRIPIRASGDGSLPAEGWSGANEWLDWVPFDELPHCYDPPEHFIVTANNRPMPPDYPHFLGRDWHPPFRAQRIADLLLAKERLTLDDFAAIQGDTLSLFSRAVLPGLLAQISPRDEIERRAIDLLRSWDGDARADSAAAALFQVWFAKLTPALLNAELDSKLIGRYQWFFSFVSRFLIDTVKQQPPAQPEGGDVSRQEAGANAVEQAFRDALAHVQAKLGGDMKTWRWDGLHVAVFPHLPFHQVRPLRRFFSRSIPHGGDWSTVNFGPYLFDGAFKQVLVAGYRQVVDLSNYNSGQFIQSSGQSGNPLSACYDDYLSDWCSVRYRSMRFDRAAVEYSHKAILWLKPD
jgi:penicillin G amidase